MALFNFGQPVNGYCQLGFVVEDIRQSMESFTKHMGAGPWFLMDRVQIKDVQYRGRVMQIPASLAYANSGHVQFELIQQHDQSPSLFTEMAATRPYGLHHQGIAVRNFEAELQRFKDMGYEVAAYGENDVRSRAAFMDPKGAFPTLIEIMEANEMVEAMFTAIYQASVGWHGNDPVRPVRRYSDIFSLAAPAVPESVFAHS